MSTDNNRPAPTIRDGAIPIHREGDSLHDDLLAAIRTHSDMDDAQIIEAGTHGADTGWPGFSYTADCVAFYRVNERAIWRLLEEVADQMGMKPLELVSTFGRSDMAVSLDGFANLLAWFALEEVGRRLSDRSSVDS